MTEIKKGEGGSQSYASAPCKVLAGTIKKVSFIDAEFCNKVLEIKEELLELQQKIESIEPGFDVEEWLARRGL